MANALISRRSYIRACLSSCHPRDPHKRLTAWARGRNGEELLKLETTAEAVRLPAGTGKCTSVSFPLVYRLPRWGSKRKNGARTQFRDGDGAG